MGFSNSLNPLYYTWKCFNCGNLLTMKTQEVAVHACMPTTHGWQLTEPEDVGLLTSRWQKRCLYNASVSPSAGQLHQSGWQKLAAHHHGSCCQPDFISVLHNATVEHGISHFPPGHTEAADGDSVLCKWGLKSVQTVCQERVELALNRAFCMWGADLRNKHKGQ